MPKRETMTVAIAPTQRKFRGPNIGPKFRKEFKKVNKALISHLARTFKASYVKQTITTT